MLQYIPFDCISNTTFVYSQKQYLVESQTYLTKPKILHLKVFQNVTYTIICNINTKDNKEAMETILGGPLCNISLL